MMTDADLSTAQHTVMLAMMALALAVPVAVMVHTALTSGRGHAFGPPLRGCPPAGSGRRPVVPPGRRRPLLLLVFLGVALVLAGCSEAEARRQSLSLLTAVVAVALFTAFAGAIAAAMRPRRDPMADPFGDVPHRPEE